MAAKPRRYNPEPVSDLVSEILDPVLARKAGITTGLIQAWEEIVGPRLAAGSRPHSIRWPKRATADAPFEPAMLVIACDSISALHVQHQTGEIIARVNAFLGFAAIDRVRIVQKPVSEAVPRRKPRSVSPEEMQRLEERLAVIDDEGLRAALLRLGASVAAARKS